MQLHCGVKRADGLGHIAQGQTELPIEFPSVGVRPNYCELCFLLKSKITFQLAPQIRGMKKVFPLIGESFWVFVCLFVCCCLF